MAQLDKWKDTWRIHVRTYKEYVHSWWNRRKKRRERNEDKREQKRG